MALVTAEGTPLAKSPGGSVLETVPEADPKVKVLVNVYRDTPYDRVDYPTQMRQLAFRAGQIVSLKKWNAEFEAPTIASVSPSEGPAAGGTEVTITGTRFSTDAAVTFGGAAATEVVEVNSKTITCKTPAGEAGAVDVVVTTAGGSATAEEAFTYTA